MAAPVLTPAVSGKFQATLVPTAGQKITVAQFTSRTAPTPGNVAVCLSGGGSRALCAGMGQLQALEAVQINGASLLSQVKAVSTVSGGSWVGVSFVYLTPGTGDNNYLGTFVNPSQLSPSSVSSLPNGNIGSQVTAFFTMEDIAISALLLYLISGRQLAPNMLWQSVIGLHMLAPYGLYSIKSLIPPNFTPNSYFTYDAATQKFILNSNPALSGEAGNLVSTASSETRPYMVCNMAMFVKASGETLLAPVQATPSMTGIVGVPPNAKDANGRQVGGGGVTSFAFSSDPVTVSGSSVTVQQARQMSLVDIVGTSSAAFAVSFEEITAPLARQLSEWKTDLQARKHSNILPALARAGQHLGGLLQQASSPGDRSRIRTNKYLVAARALAMMPSLELAAHAPVLPAGVDTTLDDILKAIDEILKALIPEYDYWPVLNTPAGQSVNPTQFADGGSLENSGIAAMLAYSDIDNIVSFINTETPLAQTTVNGQKVIVVDDSIPPLFGFQPFNSAKGYVPYSAGGATGSKAMYKNSQVFPSANFQDLLNGLWAASGSGSFQRCPVFKQQLTTVENRWFGVPVGRKVSVLWNYLERCQTWFGSLQASVQPLVPQNFPHYNTILETQLTPTQVNLLANLTAWNIAVENTSLFEGMFK